MLLADFAIVFLVLAPVLALILLKINRRWLAMVLVVDVVLSCLCMMSYVFLFMYK